MIHSVRKLEELIKDDDSKINLLAYYDGATEASPTMYYDFSEPGKAAHAFAATVKKSHGRNTAEVSLPANENAATMQSIYNFVDWCVSSADGKRGRTADNYALIVSGHGSGFQNLSFLQDARSNYYMTIPTFRKTLKWIKEDLITDGISILGFDNCVMGMLEIGNELQDYVKYMVASEGYIPNAGWPYEIMLGNLISDTRSSQPAEVAKGFVTSFIELQKTYAFGGVSVDISAWELSSINDLAKAADALGEILLKGFHDPLSRRLLKMIIVQAHYECQSYMFEQNVDLKDFSTKLLENLDLLGTDLMLELDNVGTESKFNLQTELKRRCEAVNSAVDKCILISGFSGGKFQYSNGAAIFFPWTATVYNTSKDNYEKLAFVRSDAPYWNRFLRMYLDVVSLREAQPVESFDGPDYLKFLNFTLEGVTDDSLSEAHDKVINNTENKVINNTENKVINNTDNRVINNTGDKVINNTANRLLSVMGLTTIDFKNVSMPWWVSGYAKKDDS